MAALNPAMLNARHVRARFDRAASRFAGADFVHRAAADGLLQRMQAIVIQPRHVVDLGCALGGSSKQLCKRFPKARLLSIDLSWSMLKIARQSRGWFSRAREIQAEAGRLPLTTGSVDCLYANMLLPWIDDLPATLSEFARVLRKDGVFVFSTLGPESLAEIRNAWGRVDDGLHVHHFADMHDLGDAMMQAGFSDPVLDVDYLSVTYRDAEAIFRDLRAAGAGNSLRDRHPALIGKERMASFRGQLESLAVDGVIELKLELVFGHAFGRGARVGPQEFTLALKDIGRRRN
jgi:malonyl-CoA O-methyltransferase